MIRPPRLLVCGLYTGAYASGDKDTIIINGSCCKLFAVVIPTFLHMASTSPKIGPAIPGMFYLYGVNFPKEWKPPHSNPKAAQFNLMLGVELYCFQQKISKRMQWDLGGSTPRDHFKRVALMLYPENNKDGPAFRWHPAAERMLDGFCENKYLGVAGSSGFGKSVISALWSIINYLSSPHNTMVIVTSVSLEGARGRIWGQIEKFWSPLEKMGFPGKLVSSRGMIVYAERNGAEYEKTQGNLAGIMLVASDKRKNASEATAKFQGLHQDTVIFVADELSEISESVPESAWSNLASGTRLRFQFIGISNPVSYTDAFGKFTKPKAGWASIDVNTGEWETDFGKCLHFDDLKNPNVLAGRKIYDWMRTQEDFDAVPEAKRNSSQFWKMYRGFWCPMGLDNTIYSDVEIVSTKSDQPAIWLGDDTIWLSGLDYAPTAGGDRCVAYYGKLGTGINGLKTLEFKDYEIFFDNVENQTETISEQIISKWRKSCEARKIPAYNCGFDNTGVGIAFGHMLSMLWSKDILKVDFGGKASDLPVSAYDKTPSSEHYYNRVSEIWHVIKEYLQTGQIRGIHPDMQREMTARKVTEDGGRKIRIESKKEMKMRTGESPDICEAAMILSVVARERFGFYSKAVDGDRKPLSTTQGGFKKLFRKMNSIYIND